jgi:hypothetical protein
VVRIHSPRPPFSNTYRHSHYNGRIQAGSGVDPTLTRMSDSAGRCHRVLISLLSDDFNDPLSLDQEVY